MVFSQLESKTNPSTQTTCTSVQERAENKLIQTCAQALDIVHSRLLDSRGVYTILLQSLEQMLHQRVKGNVSETFCDSYCESSPVSLPNASFPGPKCPKIDGRWSVASNNLSEKAYSARTPLPLAGFRGKNLGKKRKMWYR